MIRSSLKTWCIEALSRVDLKPARHHELLIDRLEAIERGDITRLMVLMPPGSAKSTYVSTLFPPWYLARHPQDSIVAASHTSELSERFGRRVRNIINEHAATLGISLAPDIQAANQWETTEGGEYFAVGVLGAVTGRRADCLPGDTEVLTKSGFCAIKNIEVGTQPATSCPMTERVVSQAFDEWLRLLGAKRISSSKYELPRDEWLRQREIIEFGLRGVGSHRRPLVLVTFSCERCGAPKTRSAAEARKWLASPWFCGQVCNAKHQAEIRSPAPMQTLVCHSCRKPFERVGYEARKKAGKNAYCSPACLTVAKITNVCRNCGKPVRRARTCSQKCRLALSMQAGAKRRHERVPLACRNCGTTFTPKQANSKAQYCGKPCADAAHAARMKGQSNPAYRHGLGTERGSSREWFAAKRAVWDRDGMRCVVCSADKSLDVHHINHTPNDHRLENLVSLCRLCHRRHHAAEKAIPSKILWTWLSEYAETKTSTISKSKELSPS